MPYALTKKEIKQEVVKCGRNPAYFLKNFSKIRHPEEGLIPFNTYYFQDDLLDNFRDHRFNIVLKARQLGISTIAAGYVAWLMNFHRNKEILVVATKQETAKNLVTKVKGIYKSLPKWLQIGGIESDSKTLFELKNGSIIKASATSSDAGRSEALSLLIIDEAAFVENIDDMWAAVYPTLSTGGRCLAISTPNGVGNWYHKMFSEAEDEQNLFHTTTLMWDVHPDRDQIWFENETKNMSRREIAQELECNFNMSGETVIHPEDIERMAKSVLAPSRRAGFDRNYYIWEEYKPERSYIISADVARGDGNDYSTFHVIDLVDVAQVAEYQGKPDIDMFATFLGEAGREYGGCMIVVENNNIGYAVLMKLIESGYPNVYYSIKGSNEHVEQYIAEQASNAVPGFTTTAKTRPLLIAKLEEFIRNKIIKVYSKRLVNEVKTFIWNNGKPEAMKSYNDDLVMALAIACWVRDTALIENQRDVEYKKAMLNCITTSVSTLDTTIPGQIGHRFNKAKHVADKKEEMMWDDLAWIYRG